ncbi:gamma-glutamyltransferase [Roseovarius nubinhibens]|uniref:Gamma-glutamyltranspeptidase n=1 Tax=Roseovarius nubinhibens TaxID=314263 RepID=A0A348WFK7_9RHOB|nr:hypothetical protein [Roseovarius nubinhibens]|tara:strand:- start:7026 stop:8594 length:1569 start_codon:yes stop_codon:yes gene_type:complete
MNSVLGPSPHLTQNWEVTKAAAEGRRGVVVTQARDASNVGAEILSEGGSAADAAVGAALALAVVEPWNSGLGGVGFGVLRDPNGGRWALDFGPVSPRHVAPEYYPLTGDNSAEIFGWPKVEGDVNVHGPLSFCSPAAVAGLGTLHDRFGKLPWSRVVEPAIDLARRGMARDWFSTAKIAQMMHLLRLYPETAKIYLPEGLLPVAAEKGNATFLSQGKLADTLALLARDGWKSFYNGEAADLLAADLRECGALLTDGDLRDVRATLTPARVMRWHGLDLALPPEGCGVDVLLDTLKRLERPTERNVDWYVALSGALLQAYRTRIAEEKDNAAEPPRETCTTHLSACDGDGMMVSLTTTLLGLMGSAVALPRTGVLMNNGMMWFDPRPGRENSIAPSTRPKSNMLPLLCETETGARFALGASGGRRIVSAVLNAMADVGLFGMAPAVSAHAPRIDVSGPDMIVADRRFDPEIAQALSAVGPVTLCEHAAAPLNFGCPSILMSKDGLSVGQPDVMTPWSTAIAVS